MLQDNKIYVQLVTERSMLEKLIEELNIRSKARISNAAERSPY